MSLLDFLDKIPDKIFPRLEATNFQLYVFWREVCHFIASCLLIMLSHSLFLIWSIYIPIIIFTLLGSWMTYQEFWLHPKKYEQKLWNGILDWLVWMVPFIIYLNFLYKI